MTHLSRLITLPSGRSCWLDLEVSLCFDDAGHGRSGLRFDSVESAKLHGIPIRTGRAEELYGEGLEYDAVAIQEREAFDRDLTFNKARG